MGELFSDVWVWAFAGGALLCGAALPFLIKKARTAGAEPLAGSISVPTSFVEDEPIPVLKTPKAEVPAEPAPVVFPPPAAAPAPAAERPDRANVTGPVGRGEKFVGEIMGRMSHFESEINQLRSQVQGFAEAHDKEFKVLLQKMGEFQAELHKEMQSRASAVPAAKPPASAPAPAAKPPATAPVPAVKPPVAAAAPSPAPAPKPAPTPTPAPVAKPPAAAPPVAAPAPAPAAVPPPASGGIELGPPRFATPAPKPAPAPAPKPAVEPTAPIDPAAAAAAAAEKTVVMPPRAAEPAGLSLRAPGGEPQSMVPPPAVQEEDPGLGSKGPVWPV